MADQIMAEVDIDYDDRYQRYHLTIPSRKEKVVIEKINPESTLFRIRYESGKQIPELDGWYSGKIEAFRAFRSWFQNSKVSKEVLRDEWFGDKEPPKLQRKKVTRKRKVDVPITSTEGG